MPHKVKISGSRSLKKGSKKSSKKQSKSKRSSKRSSKHAGMDFTAILDDMSNKTSMSNMMGPQQMQPDMQMDQSGQMMDPNMMMQQQAAMQGQMMDPNMMMMGKNSQSAQGAQEQDIDPLHIQYIVPQNKNLNINNYGISYDQLLKGSQHNGLSDTFNSQNAQQNMNNVQQKMDEMKVN